MCLHIFVFGCGAGWLCNCVSTLSSLLEAVASVHVTLNLHPPSTGLDWLLAYVGARTSLHFVPCDCVGGLGWPTSLLPYELV